MSETIETQLLAKWLNDQGYWFTKSPNETYTTSWRQKRKNTLEGVSAGFPDMMIVLKRGALLFIELKIPRTKKKNGEYKAFSSDGIEMRQNQVEWIQTLDDIDNVRACFCYGFDEAKRIIQESENIV